MKKLIAIPILLGLIFMTSFLPALNLFFTDAESYIDRNIVCKWVDVDAPDAYMLEAVMEGDPVCRGAFSGRPYYPYGSCIKKCEPLAIAHQIVHAAEQTADAIKERVKLILASRPI